MARRKSAAVKEREARYARAAQVYQARTDIPQKAYSGRIPRVMYGYRPIFYRQGDALDQVPLIKLRCSKLAVDKFGRPRLNLSDDIEAAIEVPAAFEPSMLRASVNRSGNPIDKIAYGGTGRPYRKYTADSTSASRAHFNAPVCVTAGDTSPTLQELMLVIRAAISDKATILGANGGSISYSLESLGEIEF